MTGSPLQYPVRCGSHKSSKRGSVPRHAERKTISEPFSATSMIRNRRLLRSKTLGSSSIQYMCKREPERPTAASKCHPQERKQHSGAPTLCTAQYRRTRQEHLSTNSGNTNLSASTPAQPQFRERTPEIQPYSNQFNESPQSNKHTMSNRQPRLR